MRFSYALAALLTTLKVGESFVPSQSVGRWGNQISSPVFSTVEAAEAAAVETHSVAESNGASAPNGAVSAADIKSKLESQLAKLREKDSKSPKLSKEDIKVVHEDDHIIVVNKPAGVLCVPGKDGFPNLAEAVYESFSCEMGGADKMVVHRLGMDTSGLVVFAKTMLAVRGMNTVFRTRKIERKYEALVSGHVEKDEGMINLPLMRDYENPPFMRVSTDAHQQALAGLDAADVGKKLLEQPKDSLTKYEVISREEYEGKPVTRVSLTSISGRTHQLNVHMAAFGHPIVGDSTYGAGGDAAPNGGLTAAELDSLVSNPNRAESVSAPSACVHAKSLKFRHPVTKEEVSLSSDAPF
mmetsp:Transcript_15972/g.30395  ORF Transcript_15972/g.30395 Transcript_15972/m.30395 type:complete len:354 (-) Transcript_15972:49-1110(-)